MKSDPITAFLELGISQTMCLLTVEGDLTNIRGDQRGALPLQTLTRTIRNELREILANPDLRGERLADAIARLGALHGIEPFRACLGALGGGGRSEGEAHSAVVAIEAHRAAMESRLKRDPGIFVAAIDYQQEGELRVAPGLGGARDPAARRAQASTDNSEALCADQEIMLELRRSERFGHPLSLVVLEPDDARTDMEIAMRSAAAALRETVRDVDRVNRVLPEGFVVVLPCTGGEAGLTAAGRMRSALESATQMSWSAGVAASPDQPGEPPLLATAARQAARRAKAGGGGAAVLHRTDRRAHARRIATGALHAALRSEGSDAEVRIGDLSIGGARISARQRIAPGSWVDLSLRQIAPRPRAITVSSKVLRVRRSRDTGPDSPWTIGVAFSAEAAARHRTAALLADLPPSPVIPRRRP